MITTFEKIGKKTLSSIFVDIYFGRDTFGMGTFHKAETMLRIAEEYTTDDAIIGVNIQPNLENPYGIHKNMIDDYVKSIIYALNFQPFVQCLYIETGVLKERKRKHIHKTTWPVIATFMLVSKQKRFNIDCIDTSREYLFTDSTRNYFMKFCGGKPIIDKLMRWKAYARWLQK